MWAGSDGGRRVPHAGLLLLFFFFFFITLKLMCGAGSEGGRRIPHAGGDSHNGSVHFRTSTQNQKTPPGQGRVLGFHGEVCVDRAGVAAWVKTGTVASTGGLEIPGRFSFPFTISCHASRELRATCGTRNRLARHRRSRCCTRFLSPGNVDPRSTHFECSGTTHQPHPQHRAFFWPLHHSAGPHTSTINI